MPNLLTVKEVAERLRMSRWTVYGLVKTGRLPAVRLNRRILLAEDSLTCAILAAEQAVCVPAPGKRTHEDRLARAVPAAEQPAGRAAELAGPIAYRSVNFIPHR